MVEQIPIPDQHYEALDLILHHQPARRSTGIANVLFRRQAWHWRRVIAQSLMGSPLDLPCWRWNSPDWPPGWEEVRQRPLRTAFFRLVWFPFCNARAQWKHERKFFINDLFNPGIHHFLLCLAFWWRRNDAADRK